MRAYVSCFVASFLISSVTLSAQDMKLDPLQLERFASVSVVPASPDTSADTSVPTQNGNIGAPPSNHRYVFPTRSEMTHYWLRTTVGPKAFVGAAFRASWTTATNSPEEWHGNFTGWSKRFGAGLLDNVMNQSSLVLLSGAMHHDPRFYRCSCSGFWPRVGHAVELTFASRNHDGRLVFSPAKVISPFVGPMVTRNTIYPDRFNAGDAVISGGTYFIGGVAWNLAREFIKKLPSW